TAYLFGGGLYDECGFGAGGLRQTRALAAQVQPVGRAVVGQLELDGLVGEVSGALPIDGQVQRVQHWSKDTHSLRREAGVPIAGHVYVPAMGHELPQTRQLIGVERSLAGKAL